MTERADRSARIARIETWVCHQDRGPRYEAQGHKFREQGRVILLRVTDSEGCEGIGTCLAETTAEGPLAYLHEVIAPMVLGRFVHERERIWREVMHRDRHLVFQPLHVYGPVDTALWDLAAKRVGLPLYQLLGAQRGSLPVYYSGQFMDELPDYEADIRRATQLGFTAYKAHVKDRFDILEMLRDVAGEGFVLMHDPADDWSYERALRCGRLLERLGYTWFEEPFKDWHVEKYARLAEALDIPIAGCEATPGVHWGVAQAIAQRAVDIVRADVSWKAGVTGTMKIAHLAESFGLNCELHATLMGPMDIANLHCACAMANTEWFELHMPETMFSFPMKEPYPIDAAGVIHVPEGPGLGITVDWHAADPASRRVSEFTR